MSVFSRKRPVKWIVFVTAFMTAVLCATDSLVFPSQRTKSGPNTTQMVDDISKKNGDTQKDIHSLVNALPSLDLTVDVSDLMVIF